MSSTLGVTGATTLSSTLAVTSTSTLTGNVGIGKASTSNALDVSGNVAISGNETIGGTLGVTGTSALTGNVGIGKASSSYALDVSGNVAISGNLDVSGNINYSGSLSLASLSVSGTVTAGAFNATSDYRIKENVANIDETYTVDNLRPVTYMHKLTKKQNIGVIAHELQEIYPILVEGEKDGDEYQSVNYIGLIGILIKEIKELKIRINNLEEKI